MLKNKIFDGLNEKQIEAVTTKNGPLQIIAGAGSGKTRVLTHRIAYLLEQGVNPYSILALTFTNKAANEMRERIAQLVDAENASKIWAGTFHSIFARILRIEANELGYNQNFTIYDTEDSHNALKRIFNTMIIPKEIKPNVVHSIISSAKNKLILPAQYAQNASTQFEKLVAETYRSYQTYLMQNNAMDFDDLLVNMVHLFYNQTILAKYQDRFHYILVDEYQDTNKVQYIAINQLAKHRQNICIVGDDAQSIYRWRGADIGNILNFQQDYPNCKVVKLEQNYRSTKNILAVADSVIEHNKNQLKKNLWTENKEGEKVSLMKFHDDRTEANKIIEIIEQNYSKGQNLNQFAVLYRTNAQSLVFENACRAMNLPYVVVGSMSFYKRKEVKDVLSYLRLLVNPRDDGSILRIINEPPRGIGNAAVDTLSNYARENRITILQTLQNADRILTARKKPVVQALKLYALIEKHTKLFEEKAEPDHYIEYIQATGIIDFYKEIDTDETNDRLANIEQLLTDIIAYIKEDESRDLQSYLEQVSLISDLDAKELSEDRITLMTLHSAKGLEFDNVFIAGMENNLFPLSSTKTTEEEEEERRLFYVGITRARNKLYLSYAAGRMRFREFQANTPSMFLREINSELLEDTTGNTFLIQKKRIGHFTSAHPRKPRKKRTFTEFNDMPYKENYSQIADINEVFKIGDIVKHNSFGVGRILNLSGIEDSLKMTIHFFNIEEKKQLLAKFAKLEKVENHIG